mgnify:CR=1 FL=1
MDGPITDRQTDGRTHEWMALITIPHQTPVKVCNFHPENHNHGFFFLPIKDIRKVVNMGNHP